MNRVVQAIGRVTRSETDHGVVLLIDARFNEALSLAVPHLVEIHAGGSDGLQQADDHFRQPFYI